jgi:hypothetical protein
VVNPQAGAAEAVFAALGQVGLFYEDAPMRPLCAVMPRRSVVASKYFDTPHRVF